MSLINRLIFDIVQGLFINFRLFPKLDVALPDQKNKIVAVKECRKICTNLFRPNLTFCGDLFASVCSALFHSHYILLLVTLKILDNWPQKGENNSQLRTGERKGDVRYCSYLSIFTGHNKAINIHNLHSH